MPCSAASLFDALRSWPFVEAIIFAVWLVSVLAAWKNVPSTATEGVEDVNERQLGAEVILAQLNGIITGSSIIIAGVGAFVAISNDLPPPASKHLQWAALFSIIGLSLAMYTLGTLPSRAPKHNLVRSKAVAVFCAIALFFSLAGAVRFVLGAIASIG